MTSNKAQHCSVRSRDHARLWIILCLCAVQFGIGCSPRKNNTRSWRGAGMMRPSLPTAISTMSPPKTLPDVSVDPVPELRLELPPPPPALAFRNEPARPHVTPPPAPENIVSRKPEAPVIAPQLSPAETTSARQQMLASLGVAEKNLARSQGKTLSATQSDLAAKVKGFIGDARAAGHDGDWTRARSLATKAQVLSEELIASL
jgi:hypothetical protein